MTGPEHFAPTARRLIANLRPKEPHMTDTTTAITDEAVTAFDSGAARCIVVGRHNMSDCCVRAGLAAALPHLTSDADESQPGPHDPLPARSGRNHMNYLNPHTHNLDRRDLDEFQADPRTTVAAVRAALNAWLGADRPRIVCLCGSTRFYDQFQQANYDLTMSGAIVLSVGFYPHAQAEHGHGEGVGHDSAEKVALDELHKRKIDLADEVLVLNVGGYVGSSTRSEVRYALGLGKPIRWLEPVFCCGGTGFADYAAVPCPNPTCPAVA